MPEIDSNEVPVVLSAGDCFYSPALWRWLCTYVMGNVVVALPLVER